MIMKSYKYHINTIKALKNIDFPWMVGMLYTAHKVLHTYVVILLPSCNDAYGPPPAAIMYSDNYPKRVQRPPEGPEGPPSPSQELEGEHGVPRTSSRGQFYNILYIAEQSHSWMSTLQSPVSLSCSMGPNGQDNKSVRDPRVFGDPGHLLHILKDVHKHEEHPL